MSELTIHLPPELEEALRDTARETGKPESTVVREALETYLLAPRRRRLRSLGLGDDPELNGVDTEDWLTKHWQPD